jgi:mannose-1-phosphate guanylyltransferase/mannose-6-phosphate isomerase
LFKRPWGFYEVLDAKRNFLTKKIIVFPKSKLSLQKHNYRFEHWVVLSGTATVQIEKKFIKLKKNQSIDIPIKKIHRLINDTNKNLELIEVQSGSYIDEDDIERIDDEYNR